MKIIIIGTAHPYRGGLANYNEQLAKTLQEKGNQVVLWTFTLQYPTFLFPGKNQYQQADYPKNLNIKRKINSINPINWLRVGKMLQKEKSDLIVIKYWLPFFAPCFGTILKKIRGQTMIISILDNIIPHEKRVGDWYFTKYFVKQIDGFITMSKNVLKDLALFDTNKPRAYSPHPLFNNFGKKISKEQALNNLKLCASKRYILFFGIIRKYKGLELLINAFSDPYFRNKDIELVIVGEFYTNKKPYMKLINNHPFKEKINLVEGFVPNEEVKNFFCASNIIVQPYLSATQSGVSQIAYHFNTPMIVTDVGGLRELCPEGKVGFVVKPQAEEIAKTLKKFFENPHYQREMEAEIENEKKKYSWDILANNILKLYHDKIY